MDGEDDGLAFAPPHPGEVLREDMLPALNMSVTELAQHLGVSRQSLSPIINGRRSISVEMAQRLGKAFGNGARFWLALQIQWDIWQAEHGAPVHVERLHWKDRAA